MTAGVSLRQRLTGNIPSTVLSGRSGTPNRYAPISGATLYQSTIPPVKPTGCNKNQRSRRNHLLRKKNKASQVAEASHDPNTEPRTWIYPYRKPCADSEPSKEVRIQTSCQAGCTYNFLQLVLASSFEPYARNWMLCYNHSFIVFCSLVQCLLENHHNPAINHISEFDVHLDMSLHDLVSLQ